METLTAQPYAREITLLFFTAMAVFVFTVVIGILNGTDVVDFDQKVLLAHVHVGTLGWLTLSAMASTLWLFGTRDDRGWRATAPTWLAGSATLLVVAYNIAFLTTYGNARPVLGTLMGLVIVGFLTWAIAQLGSVEASVPRLGFLVALATSVSGAVLGILWGIQLANETQALPTDGEGAHPATMVVGFLVPVALAISEWWLAPDRARTRASRSGAIQMGLLFAAGVIFMVGVLLGITPLIALNQPLEIAAIVIFAVRNRRELLGVRWFEATAARFLVISFVALVVDIVYLMYLVSQYADDFEAAPFNMMLALDHLMFIGVMTNAVFGLLDAATRERADLAPWAGHGIFWATNVGIAGFFLGLAADSTILKQLSTPVMGIGLLLGLAVYTWRLWVTGSGMTQPDASTLATSSR